MATRILSRVFGGAVRLRNSLYDAGALPAKHLKGPVVSIGNLAVGGSGKTPFVILLGELLKSRGIAFDVLSRGYRRQTSGVALVDPGGLPRDFGDEPLLIARRLQCPVILGEERYQAGRLAEERFGAHLHLLDDGFQHRQLARDFDIVLVTPDDARDRLLPAGRLREPLSALRRADAVVLASGAEPANFPLRAKPCGVSAAALSPATCRRTRLPSAASPAHRAFSRNCARRELIRRPRSSFPTTTLTRKKICAISSSSPSRTRPAVLRPPRRTRSISLDISLLCSRWRWCP